MNRSIRLGVIENCSDGWPQAVIGEACQRVLSDPSNSFEHYEWAMTTFKRNLARSGRRSDTTKVEAKIDKHLVDGLMAVRQTLIYVQGLGATLDRMRNGSFPSRPSVPPAHWITDRVPQFRDSRANDLMGAAVPILEAAATIVLGDDRRHIPAVDHERNPYHQAWRLEQQLRTRLQLSEISPREAVGSPLPQQVRDVVAGIHSFDQFVGDLQERRPELGIDARSWSDLQRLLLLYGGDMWKIAATYRAEQAHVAFDLDTDTAAKGREKRQRRGLSTQTGLTSIKTVVAGDADPHLRFRMLEEPMSPASMCQGVTLFQIPDDRGGFHVQRRAALMRAIGGELTADCDEIDPIDALTTTLYLLCPRIAWKDPRFERASLDSLADVRCAVPGRPLANSSLTQAI